MKKVLIIGAKGMLGQELVREFSGTYKVTAWDREEIDITAKKVVDKKIEEMRPDIIVNAAAYNAVDKCEEDEAEYVKAKALNGDAPGYLMQAAKKIDATLVHYSTDYVFNGMPDISEPAGCAGACESCTLHEGYIPDIGFCEDDQPEPISRYGESKLLGERLIQKASGTDGKYYIIRLSKLFGKQGASDQAKRSFFDVMLELGKKNGEVKVVDEETSCFTYAPDLAKKTREIIEAKKPRGIYHITNREPATWYEAATELFRLANVDVKVIPISSDEFPRPAKRPFVSVLLNSKLNPMRTYQEALSDYLKGRSSAGLDSK